MTTTNKPSIAELKRQTGEPDPESCCLRCHEQMSVPAELEPSALCDRCAQWLVSEALPVVLEIAASALLMHGPCDHPEGRCANGTHFRGCSRFDGDRRLDAALRMVRQ